MPDVEDDVPYAHVIQRHVYILDGLIDRGLLSLVLYTQVLTDGDARSRQLGRVVRHARKQRQKTGRSREAS